MRVTRSPPCFVRSYSKPCGFAAFSSIPPLPVRGGAVRQTLHGHSPLVGRNVFLAHNASVQGKVTVGANSSLWYRASVIAGEQFAVAIGSNVHLQVGRC